MGRRRQLYWVFTGLLAALMVGSASRQVLDHGPRRPRAAWRPTVLSLALSAHIAVSDGTDMMVGAAAGLVLLVGSFYFDPEVFDLLRPRGGGQG